jgi:hypothetical protein
MLHPVEPVDTDGRKIVNWKSARTLFVGALALYIFWFGALVALAILSADRPADAKVRSAPAAGSAPVVPEQPKE